LSITNCKDEFYKHWTDKIRVSIFTRFFGTEFQFWKKFEFNIPSTKWSMDWWQYPQLILPQQIPTPEPTTVLSFGLSVAILRLTSIPSFREPFLLGTSFQQKPPKLRSSMHSSIVFRSSAFHLHRRDIPSGSLPITFQIQIQNSCRQGMGGLLDNLPTNARTVEFIKYLKDYTIFVH